MLARETAQKEKLRKDTGKTFQQWVGLARKQGPESHRELTAWLRSEHKLKSMLAWWIASSATHQDEPDYDDPVKLVDALYSGSKAALRPLHEKVVDAALELGNDVLVTSCKTMVPIYRKHVFAELRPVEGGVEVAMALGSAPSKRFEPVRRNAGDRLTHRIVLSAAGDLDREFSRALRSAYEAGAGKISREIDLKVPADLASKLTGKAAATWESCTPAMRRDWIVWIDSAKQADTRARRIEQTAAKLSAGKKRMY